MRVIKIQILVGDDSQRHIDELAAILHNSVTRGTSVSFMNPLTMTEAVSFLKSLQT